MPRKPHSPAPNAPEISVYDPISKQAYSLPEERILQAIHKGMGSIELASRHLNVPCSWLYEVRKQTTFLDPILRFWEEHREEMIRQKVFEKAMEGHWAAIQIVRKEMGLTDQDPIDTVQEDSDELGEQTQEASDSSASSFMEALARLTLVGGEGGGGDGPGDGGAEEDPPEVRAG